jgi:hypothetical protein
MVDLRTAQQALEALRGYRREMSCHQPCDAEVALEAALAQPEPEPVAWLLTGGTDVYLAAEFSPGLEHEYEWTPLYTHPPRREWRGLTYEETQLIHDTYHKRMGPQEFARAIEAALKEKNHE